MSRNKLFLDTNILLEILFQRDQEERCIQILQNFEDLYISSTSLVTVYYFCEKYNFDLEVLENFLMSFELLSCGEDEYDFAKKIFAGKDMEDALQIACALNNNISSVLTLDRDMQKKYEGIISFLESH